MPSNEEILNYVMNTPNNTNPAVLKDMLNNNSGGNPGYDVETVTVDVIPEQTVTLEPDPEGGKYAYLTLAEGVAAAPETMSVVINGDEYELTADVFPGGSEYILPDESATIVIFINSDTGEWSGLLSCDGSFPDTVTISASATETNVTVTDDFKKAVAEAGGGSGGLLVVGIESSSDDMVMDKTWQEIADSDFAVCIMEGPSSRGQAYITNISASNNTVDVAFWNPVDDAFGVSTFWAQDADSYPRYGKA